MQVALVQLAANPSGTCALGRAVRLVEEAAEQGANVVALPELFRWEYPCQTMEPGALARAETIEGPTVQAISEVAATRQVVVLVPFMERRAWASCRTPSLLSGPAAR